MLQLESYTKVLFFHLVLQKYYIIRRVARSYVALIALEYNGLGRDRTHEFWRYDASTATLH
ncbi:hypothetical protein C0J52_07463 [Blattella germanica]|nr:hypothetical protein C0J52_07463 [Blattella germanica]